MPQLFPVALKLAVFVTLAEHDQFYGVGVFFFLLIRPFFTDSSLQPEVQ